MAWPQPRPTRERPDTFRRTALVITITTLAQSGQVIRFCKQILRAGVVEHGTGQQALELGVLVLKALQPLGLGDLHAAKLGLLGVERRAADTMPTAHLGRRATRFLLPQDADDLLFAEL